MADRSENQELLYDKLKNSKFKQQKLPGWRPIPSMTCNTVFFVCFGLVFIGIGAAIIYFSKQIVEKREEYFITNDTITITIEKDMKAPIMVYYELNNFYQNHRRYMKSKSIKQLNGTHFTIDEMRNSKNCDPFVTNREMGVGNNTLENDSLAIPCGLMAKSYFNDRFKEWKIIKKDRNEIFTVNEKNIALDFEKKNYGNVNLSQQWIDMTDEHFIVWMRPAGLPNFRKLWGRIEERSLYKDDVIKISLDNKFNAASYNATKYIVLSTVNQFGGKNMFLGISYIVIGGICLILSVVFFIGFKMHKKKEK